MNLVGEQWSAWWESWERFWPVLVLRVRLERYEWGGRQRIRVRQ